MYCMRAEHLLSGDYDLIQSMHAYVHLQSIGALAELGKLLYESNILQTTSYFYEEVIYILLYQKSNSVILLLLSKVIILCHLVTSYLITLIEFTYTHSYMQNTNFTKKTRLL